MENNVTGDIVPVISQLANSERFLRTRIKTETYIYQSSKKTEHWMCPNEDIIGF